MTGDTIKIVSIHAPYAGSDLARDRSVGVCTQVSIHAPYAGSDMSQAGIKGSQAGFNPRPLCRERLGQMGNGSLQKQFQSTPPMQGATTEAMRNSALMMSFNPRPLCRERLHPMISRRPLRSFQSTPPMQGATAWTCGSFRKWKRFQSTPPMQGATLPPRKER